jgi:amino acid transporter
MLPALLTMAMALTAVWLIPVAAWAVLGCLGWLAVLEVLAMNEMHTSMFGETYHHYEMLGGDEQAALVFAAVGAVYLIWLCVGFMRGRVRSGLVGDMADMRGEK